MSASQSKPVKVDRYTWPGGHLGRSIVVTGIIMALSARREVISPGSPLYDYVLAGRPTAIKWATYVQAGIFYFLFGAHSIETVYFAFAKLNKHGVPLLSVPWFQWMLSCFVGGKFTMEHFENLVTSKTA